MSAIASLMPKPERAPEPTQTEQDLADLGRVTMWMSVCSASPDAQAAYDRLRKRLEGDSHAT